MLKFGSTRCPPQVSARNTQYKGENELTLIGARVQEITGATIIFTVYIPSVVTILPLVVLLLVVATMMMIPTMMMRMMRIVIDDM
jgi:hypothetical protein